MSQQTTPGHSEVSVAAFGTVSILGSDMIRMSVECEMNRMLTIESSNCPVKNIPRLKFSLSYDIVIT